MKINPVLFQNVPMNEVYNWLIDAKETGCKAALISYNKQTNTFSPIYCKNEEDIQIWEKYLKDRAMYSNDIIKVDVDAIEDFFS